MPSVSEGECAGGAGGEQTGDKVVSGVPTIRGHEREEEPTEL